MTAPQKQETVMELLDSIYLPSGPLRPILFDRIKAIKAALQREHDALREVAEEMQKEKIEIMEVWHNDGIGGSAGDHLVREVANARLEWSARIRAIMGEK